jgi:hypothetical protein
MSLGPMIERAEVCRVVRFYPAYVEGADLTALGFAHLPANRPRTLHTDIPRNFNERHQRNFSTQGEVLADDRERGRFYHIRYSWWREPLGARPQARFTFERGRPADETAWVRSRHGESSLSAGAGE